MTPSETLSHIATRLAGTRPTEFIADLAPRTRADAITWVGRLPYFDEFRGEHPEQAVALARVISQRAMREFGLTLGQEGRVVDLDRPSCPPTTPR